MLIYRISSEQQRGRRKRNKALVYIARARQSDKLTSKPSKLLEILLVYIDCGTAYTKTVYVKAQVLRHIKTSNSDQCDSSRKEAELN